MYIRFSRNLCNDSCRFHQSMFSSVGSIACLSSYLWEVKTLVLFPFIRPGWSHLHLCLLRLLSFFFALVGILLVLVFVGCMLVDCLLGTTAQQLASCWGMGEKVIGRTVIPFPRLVSLNRSFSKLDDATQKYLMVPLLHPHERKSGCRQ